MNDDSQIQPVINGYGFRSHATLGNGLRPGTKPTDRHGHRHTRASDRHTRASYAYACPANTHAQTSNAYADTGPADRYAGANSHLGTDGYRCPCRSS